MPPKGVAVTLSRATLKRRALLLLALALFTGVVAAPVLANPIIDFFNSTFGTRLGHITKGFVLGLDLQGGTRLEYEADVSNVSEAERRGALEGVRDVIERRVNSIGVAEPIIQTARVGDAWRVSVELAGIRDVNQAIRLIGETPILEFKEQNADAGRELTSEEKTKIETTNAEAKARAQKNLEQMKSDVNAGKELGFLKGQPELASLYDAIKSETLGLIPRVIDTDRAYVTARIEEVKEAGKEVKAAHLLIQYAGAGQAPTSTTRTKEEAQTVIRNIQAQITPRNFISLSKKYSEEPGAQESGGDLGWFGKDVMVSEFEGPAFTLAKGKISGVVETPFGFHLIYKMDERNVKDVRVRALQESKLREEDVRPTQGEWKNTALTGKQLKRAQVDFDQRTGMPQVSLQFDDEGEKLFAEITRRNIGKPVAIFLDGQPISIPTVQTEIPNGQAIISGSFSIQEAKLLAQRLQAGALPVPIKLIAQQSVGPTLGQDSVRKSLIAGLWGFAFVALFMLVLYRIPGLLAILSLLLYVGVSFTIFKTLPVTLTLAGIAGFILSLGIAVDANVLVFERLKEELRSGKGYGLALEEAFRRAWPSIRDGNTTTLISCATLYWFSSSVIKGFALTLAIGVLLSLFTAIVVTRTLMRLINVPSLIEKAPRFFLRPRTPKV